MEAYLRAILRGPVVLTIGFCFRFFSPSGMNPLKLLVLDSNRPAFVRFGGLSPVLDDGIS